MPFDPGDYEANKEKEAARQKAYYEANKEKLAAQQKAYREANKEKIAAQKKAYREANKERIAAQYKAYREANKEKIAGQKKAYYEANKEKLAAQQKAYREANKEKLSAQEKAYREANKEKYMLHTVRKRAKENNIPFNLTEDYLKSIYPSDMICPVLGFEMSVGVDENGWTDTSPSLDRIIPEKGYVQGNVVVVSMRANSIKTNATPEEIRKVADFYEKVFDHLDDVWSATKSVGQLDLDFTNES